MSSDVPAQRARLTRGLLQGKLNTLQVSGPKTHNMTCSRCGSDNPANSLACEACGCEILSHDRSPASAWPPDDAEQVPTSKLALAALALGLLAIFPPAGIGAIVLGHVALVGIRKSAGGLRGDNVARLALACGYLGLALFAVALFGAAHYLKVPVKELVLGRANHVPSPTATSVNTSAPSAKSLQEIHGMNALLQLSVAETVHYHSNPKLGYACTTTQLQASGFTDEVLTAVAEQGYNLSISSCTQGAGGKITSYIAFAQPRTGSGLRSFCTDHTSRIRTPADGNLETCAANGTLVK